MTNTTAAPMDDVSLSSAAGRRRSEQQQRQTGEAAVTIKNAVKSYGNNNVVLRGLDMTVPKGKIYGLLGPSGCGKTTLLSSIVGRSELDSGEIMVKAFKRQDIGYMPQDLSLHENISILQTFKFYGSIFNMDTNKVLERLQELTKLLELPPASRFIDTLSGGQQRRVSLGVALLHNPNILILDEPTVGLDPVLSHSIWNHLVSFAQEGKTIIITTHYIEEARQADLIGLMRGGVLLAEESPEMLISRCNCSTLEEAFLTLSHKQESSYNTQVDDNYKIPKSTKSKNSKITIKDGFFRKHRLYSLMYKNSSLLWQNKPFVVFLLLLPLVQTYFFNLAIGHDPKGLYLAVVNNELPQKLSGKCKPEYYSGCFLDNPQDVLMSCAYIEQMKMKSMNVLHYDDLDTALKELKKNHVWGLLYFPDNYTTSLAVRFVNASRTSEFDEEHSNVQAWIDLSNQYIGNMVKSNVIYGMQDYLGEALTKCNVSSKVGSTPISFKKPIYGSVNTTFIHYASAAILCLCCYYLPVILTAGLILTEKKEGVMERMLISGIKSSEILLSTICMQMIIHCIQTALAMYVMYIHFDNPYLGDHFPTITILLLIGTEGMIFGFLIGALCSDFLFAAYLGIGSNLMMSFTCGLIWPLEAAHYLLKLAGPLMPMTAPVRALLAVTAKGWSFADEPVYMGLISIVGWSSVMVLFLYVMSRFNKDLWVLRK